MKRLLIVALLTLGACTTTSYRFTPEKADKPLNVTCGDVSYIEDHFFSDDRTSLGRFCVEEEPG